MKIDEIKKNERPREKIIENGPKNLSEVELLAIMLSSGTKNESVLDLSKRLIDNYGIDRLFRMDYKELKNISGIKMAKASKLMATFEIARRILSSNINDIALKNAQDVYNYVIGDYSFLEYEVLTIILVNSKLRIIDKKTFTNHKYDYLDFPVKEIVKFAMDKNAYGFYIVHNHPSGNFYPSNEDRISTNKIVNVCNIMNIHFFDHIIISDDKYYSMVENQKNFIV